MSTRVQRAWDSLRESVDEPTLAGVATLREWTRGELLEVSSRLSAICVDDRADISWGYLLVTPVRDFAVRVAAWQEFVGQLGDEPPTYDPVGLLEWAKQALWKLCVFADPDDACDNDEYELELWWSERLQKAAYVCGLGEHFEFRRRSPSGPWNALEPWTLDTEDLAPAPRHVVVEVFPDVELLEDLDAT